ncbi:MAG TPA: Type 1 glutamine amidotransferase-like domain-containing protein [Actinomycetota bacterium]|nr:Type 1 glutamine amidotransferase-like domain-containing protein [Actinomycetota bacterium]
MTAPTGPIALLGSGEFEPWTRKLELELLGAAATGDGTVAIVPTASALEGATFDEWARKGLEHYASIGVPARVIDLRGRDDSERARLVGELERTSMIFFSGGNAAYLASTLAGSRFWDAVLTRLHEGAAFAGCSAGACIAGSFAPESMTDAVWEERWVPGLEVVPKTWILPHFDALDRHRSGLREYFLTRIPETGVALGIDERTAVARVGGSWTVVGEGGAFLSRGPAGRRFASGESFDPEAVLAGAEGLVDRDVLLALEPLPPGAGPIALISSDQFEDRTKELDRILIERCGPRIGLVLDADPSGAAALAAQALAHYRSLGGAPRILRPDDDPGDVDLLFLAGGDPKNLVPSLQDSVLWTAAMPARRRGLGLAGSSAGAMALCERCLFAEEGAEAPTRWGRGLGPLRSMALAVHASSRPERWLAEVATTAPVDLIAMDEGTSILLEAGRPPAILGDGRVRRHAAPAPEEPPPSNTLRLYHRTAAAEEILREGFVDSLENPMRDGAWEGSWFADVPVPVEDGPEGGSVLVLEVPVELAERFEWIDPSKPYREFVLPRTVANRLGPPRVLTADGTILDPEAGHPERSAPTS